MPTSAYLRAKKINPTYEPHKLYFLGKYTCVQSASPKETAQCNRLAKLFLASPVASTPLLGRLALSPLFCTFGIPLFFPEAIASFWGRSNSDLMHCTLQEFLRRIKILIKSLIIKSNSHIPICPLSL